MRTLVLALAPLLVAASPAAPQSAAPAAAQIRAYDPAPWWMDKPIIASTGRIWTEMPANRASAGATYLVVDKDLATATKAAADKVRALGQVLETFGPEKIQVASTYSITPLYAQYRDKQGELNDNQRSDKVERYQVSVRVGVVVRDVRLIERVYAILMSAKPSSTEPVGFRLEPENETRTQMERLAVEDARRRALLSAEAAGTHLGGVRIIDPTARACETDVLVAGAGRPYADVPSYRVAAPAPPPMSQGLEEVVVTSQRKAAEVGLDPDAIRMPLQPPMERLETKACVVFGLG